MHYSVCDAQCTSGKSYHWHVVLVTSTRSNLCKREVHRLILSDSFPFDVFFVYSFITSIKNSSSETDLGLRGPRVASDLPAVYGFAGPESNTSLWLDAQFQRLEDSFVSV